MIRINRYLFIQILYVMFDTVFMALSIYIACEIRQGTLLFPVTFNNVFFSSVNPYRTLFLFWIVVTLFLNNSHGLYRTKREIFETVELWQVLRSVSLSALIVIVAIYTTKILDFPRTILFSTVVLVTLFFSLWRVAKRMFVDFIVARGYNNFNVLVIGAGRVGRSLTKEINKRPELGLKIIGCLDDFKDTVSSDLKPLVLGKISDFKKIARQEFVNKIFITSHLEEEKFVRLLEDAKELRIAVSVIPHGFELISREFNKYNIGIIPVLEYYDQEFGSRQLGKRIFDLFCSMLLSIFFLPILLILAILVKLDSPGPAFYFSCRFGRNGRKFNMIKFRSMVDKADRSLKDYVDRNEADGPIFKIRKDPRITKIGRVLRKYSLDELPQIFNVFMGDMSLVGPRPLTVDQVEREDLRQLKRLEVRPGITGLWQIRGRSDISFSRLVRWDVWYINNWSFWLDLNILFQTVPVVIKGKGAY